MTHTRSAGSRALVFCALLAVTIGASAPSEAATTDRSALLALEARWNEAIRTRDTDWLDRTLAPDFILLLDGGAQMTRDQVISAARRDRGRMICNGSYRQSVRVYGRTAVITGIYREVLERSGPGSETTARYTDVYTKLRETWTPVSAHASEIGREETGRAATRPRRVEAGNDRCEPEAEAR